MPVITFTEDWTTISTCESLTNFSGVGKTSNLDLEEDGVKEGTYWIGTTPSVTTEVIFGYDAVGGISFATNLFSIWFFSIPGFLNTYDNYGLFIRVSSSASSWTANYNDYKVGGNDVLWCEKGWHFVVLDANRTPDRTSTDCNLSSIQRVGMGYNLLATASKVPVLGFDLMQYGTKVGVTGPSSIDDTTGNGFDFNDNGGSADTIVRDDAGSFVTDGWENGDVGIIRNSANNDAVEFTVTTAAATTLTLPTGTLAQTDLNQTTAKTYAKVTFQDIYDKDNVDTSYFGVVTLSQNGLWEINYNLIIGDESGAEDIWFASRGEKVVFPDQPLDSATANQTITAAEDTGETLIHIGQSTGTGDVRVGFGGSVFTQYNTQFGQAAYINLTTAIDECDAFGSSILGITDGAGFATDTSHHVTNCSFDNCGQIALGTVEARNLTFTGYTSASDASLLWNSSIDVKNSTFLANRNDTTNSAAIEHTTTTTSTYYNLTFAGNDYDVNLTAASGTLIINKDGTSDPTSYKTGGTGSVSFVGTKPMSIHVEDIDGNDIEDAKVYVQRQTPVVYTSGVGNTSGDADLVVTQTISSDTPQTGMVTAYDVSLASSQGYRYASHDGTNTFTFITEVTGTANTGGSGTILKRKTGTAFLSADITQGDTIRNTTDVSWCVVDTIDDDDTITCSQLQGGSDNTWQEDDAYSFHKLATTLVSGTDTVDSPYINALTDATGDVSASIPNASAQGVNISVRRSSETPKYLDFNTANAITAAAGMSATIVLREDPNA